MIQGRKGKSRKVREESPIFWKSPEGIDERISLDIVLFKNSLALFSRGTKLSYKDPQNF